MNIKIISDLHLDHGLYKVPEQTEPTILCVLGDVDSVNHLDRLDQFINDAATKYQHVIYVPGNHEFYFSSLDVGEIILKELCDHYSNVTYLNNQTITLENVLFVGGTLWTDINKNNPLDVDYVWNRMNDYNYIDQLTPYHTINAHYDTKAFITNTIVNHTEDNPCIVLTHHAPSFLSIPQRFKGSKLNCAFASEMHDFIYQYSAKITLWGHGHIHDSTDYFINDTRIICNPRGYSPYDLNVDFNDEKIYNINN